MNLGEIKMSELENGEHLEHYGVTGMKWGVRRYQNADGSLTAAGKTHYGSSNSGSRESTSDKKSYARTFFNGGYLGVRRRKRKEAEQAQENRSNNTNKDKKKEYDSGSKEWKMDEARNLTDEELNRRNSRLQREKQYRDLTEPPIRKETRQAAKKILVGSATGAAAGAMAVKYKAVLAAGGKWLASSAAAPYLGAVAAGGAVAYLIYKHTKEG